MIDKKQKGINWGPFTLRIPFIHLTLLPSEFLQGLVISGATTFAGAPIVMGFGSGLSRAVACCFIASFLITCQPNNIWWPLAPGW